MSARLPQRLITVVNYRYRCGALRKLGVPAQIGMHPIDIAYVSSRRFSTVSKKYAPPVRVRLKPQFDSGGRTALPAPKRASSVGSAPSDGGSGIKRASPLRGSAAVA